MHLTITENGLVSSMPFIAYAVIMPLGGVISDAISRRNLISNLRNRKLFVIIGTVLPAGLMLSVPLVEAPSGVTALMVVAMSISSVTRLGVTANILDVAPRGGADVLGALR